MKVRRADLVAILTALEELADALAGEHGNTYATHEQAIAWAVDDIAVLRAYARLRRLANAPR